MDRKRIEAVTEAKAFVPTITDKFTDVLRGGPARTEYYPLEKEIQGTRQMIKQIKSAFTLLETHLKEFEKGKFIHEKEKEVIIALGTLQRDLYRIEEDIQDLDYFK